MEEVGARIEGPDLGDLVVVLLASTLAGLRDRLASDGFSAAARLVGDLVDIADDYITAVPSIGAPNDPPTDPH